jgi:uncharacterized protein involved in type VI secretion and phage assembly
MPASYIAIPTLKIDGQPATDSLLEDILQISIEESLHLPGMFTLVIRNDYFSARDGENPWMYDDKFAIGKSIEIGFTSSTTEDNDFSEAKVNTLINGEITAIEAQFNPESQAPIIIRGYDKSHRLHRGRYNRSFQNMKDSDIVSKIIQEVGISAGTIDKSGGPYGFGEPPGYVFQENQTNMEFLRERAARCGFELFVQDDKLNFRKPTAGDSLTLKWLKEITSFHVRISSAEQVSSVEVRGWDYQNKQAIVSSKTSQTGGIVTSINQGKGETVSKAFIGSPKMIVVDQPVSSSDESDAIAQSLYNELSGEFVQADAKAVGNPEIRPGKVIKLTEMGKYSGSYYVTETRHIFQNRFYTTEFSIRGLRGEDLLTAMTPKTRLQPGQTLLIGIVSQNKDPKKWGRVKVKFPTLTNDHESEWARVVAIGAGLNRGFDCLPEVNDEVLVGFEHGDIHRPFVIGGVWNGKDAPPTSVDNAIADDGKVRLRTFKTRTGHTLQFIEEDKSDSKKGVCVDTVYGHKLHLNDSEKVINLKTKGGHEVTLDDQNKKIEIKTSGGHTCKLDDQAKKITVNSTSEIEMSAPQKIALKVGGNSIEISTSSITLKMGANKIEMASGGIEINSPSNITLKKVTDKVELGPSGINVSSATTMTVKGLTTTVKADTAVTVSGLTVSIG